MARKLVKLTRDPLWQASSVCNLDSSLPQSVTEVTEVFTSWNMHKNTFNVEPQKDS